MKEQQDHRKKWMNAVGLLRSTLLAAIYMVIKWFWDLQCHHEALGMHLTVYVWCVGG